jgi:hypothetical protein
MDGPGADWYWEAFRFLALAVLKESSDPFEIHPFMLIKIMIPSSNL